MGDRMVTVLRFSGKFMGSPHVCLIHKSSPHLSDNLIQSTYLLNA